MIIEKKVERRVPRYVDVPQYEYVDVDVVREVEVPVKKDVYVKREVKKSVTKVIDVPEIKRVKKSYKV